MQHVKNVMIHHLSIKCNEHVYTISKYPCEHYPYCQSKFLHVIHGPTE